MAQDFIALIEGRADLTKAKQAFDSFKKQVEQPIKITIDTNGFNAAWGNIQRQFQQQGNNVGRQFNQALQRNLSNVDVGKYVSKRLINGWHDGLFNNKSALNELGASRDILDGLRKEIDSINAKGVSLQKLSFNNSGTRFTAQAVNDMGTLITLTGRWKNAFQDINGVWHQGEWDISQKYITDFTAGLKEAQKESQKLANEVQKIKDVFGAGKVDTNFTKMESGLMGISGSASSDLVKKASDAAAEYYRIMNEIQASMNGTGANMNDAQLVDAWNKGQQALKKYNNAMEEVRLTSEKMLKEGEGARAANGVDDWANKNTKALKKYGAQLEELKQQMRNASTAGELSDLQNKFKNIQSEAKALGLTGLSFGDQFKKAFIRIGEFTGIYAFTSKVRQALLDIPKEIIKIDTAMTELKKVSTASASELSDYFDSAADSAKKYGQTIDEIINSTASWTRLGYDLKDASILTDVTAELAQVGSGLNVESATEGLQATIRGFGLAAEDAKRVGDTINAVADASPIDALGIINGLERSSAVMNEMNNSLEETIGLITATTSVTQDATSAGTAWRTNKTVRVYRNMHRRTHLKPVKPKASSLQCG